MMACDEKDGRRRMSIMMKKESEKGREGMGIFIYGMYEYVHKLRSAAQYYCIA